MKNTIQSLFSALGFIRLLRRGVVALEEHNRLYRIQLEAQGISTVDYTSPSAQLVHDDTEVFYDDDQPTSMESLAGKYTRPSGGM